MAPQMLLFAEVDGAARLLERVGDRARLTLLLRKYGQLVREGLARHGGELLREGDSVVLSRFDDPGAAVAAAADLQRAVARESWPFGVNLRVRIALHSGELAQGHGGFGGLDVHRVERIAALAHGGQVLLSHPARVRLARAALPDDTRLRELAAQRLPGLHYSERLTELQMQPGSAAGALRAPPEEVAGAAEAGLIGRGAVLDALVLSMRRDELRLLTLTGAPGSGRTRLARALAGRVRHDYPDGVFFAAAGVAFEPEQLAAAILRALGLFEVGARTAFESLVEHLASLRALIVIDDLTPELGAGPMIEALLAGCSQLKVIAVGPRVLGLPFEHAFDVPGLQSAAASAAGLPEGAALQLFVERVRAFRAGFELNRNNAASVAECCERLAGAPLAIELAAASLRSTELGELSGRLAALTASAGAEPRELHAAAQAAYERLDGEQQALLRKAAAFAGSLALEADDVRLAWLGADREQARAGLAALADAGMLAHEAVLGERRLRMPQGLAAFAFQRATPDEREAALLAHARAFTTFAEAHAAQVLGERQRPAVEALVAETDNLHGALRTAVDRGDFALAARLVHALLWFWLSRAWVTDGCACVRRALAADPPAGRDRALLVAASGWLALWRGDFAASIAALDAAAAELDRTGDTVQAAFSRTGAGLAEITVGDAEKGRDRLLSELARAGDRPDADTMALALLGLGNDARARAEWEQAEAYYTQARERFAASGNIAFAGVVLHHLARLRLRAADQARARALLAEALEFGREYDNPLVIHLYLAAMGELAIARALPRVGARLFGAVTTSMQLTGVCMERAEERDLERSVAQAREQLGDVSFEAAFAEGSHWTLEEAIAAAQTLA